MWRKALELGPLDWRKLKKKGENIYNLMFKDEEIGIIVINGNNYNNMNGYIELKDNIVDSENKTLWFPRYKKGQRVFNNEYLKYFIKNRSSDKSRPQLLKNMKEISMNEYDRLHLFIYARGQMPTDSLWLSEPEEM